MSVTNIFSRKNANKLPIIEEVAPAQPIIESPIESPIFAYIESPIATTIEAVIEAPKKKATQEMIIESHPISSKNGIITGKKALFVGDKNINIVSDRYKIVQPQKVIEKFEASTNLEINVCSVNPNTGGLLLSAKVRDFDTTQSTHTCSLSFYTGHNGAHRTILALQALNHACHNQVPMLLECKSRHLISHKHLEEFDFDVLEQIICEIPLNIHNFNQSYELLRDTKYSKKQFLDDFVKQFNLSREAKNFDSKIAQVSSMYDSAKGQRKLTNDSGYKAFQAVTYYLTHEGRKTLNKMETESIKNQDKAHSWFKNITKAA